MRQLGRRSGGLEIISWDGDDTDSSEVLRTQGLSSTLTIGG